MSSKRDEGDVRARGAQGTGIVATEERSKGGRILKSESRGRRESATMQESRRGGAILTTRQRRESSGRGATRREGALSGRARWFRGGSWPQGREDRGVGGAQAARNGVGEPEGERVSEEGGQKKVRIWRWGALGLVSQGGKGCGSRATPIWRGLEMVGDGLRGDQRFFGCARASTACLDDGEW